MYNTVEQIRAAFIKDGWSSNIEFEELTRPEAEKIGSWTILRDMEQGMKFFRMVSNGNIFNCHGDVVIFNISTIKE